MGIILHPVINDVSQRIERINKSLSLGNLKEVDGAILRENYVFPYKDRFGNNAVGLGRSGSPQTDSIDEQEAKIRFIITVFDEDREGDVVYPLGRQGDNYAKNPVWFFGHQEWEIPIGVSRSPDGRITVYPEENRVLADCYFDKHDSDAMFIFGKVQRGILNATSIAFVPIEAYKRDQIHKARTFNQERDVPTGWFFKTWDHTETSIVGVPSNAGAIRDTLDSEKSFITPKLQKGLGKYAAQANLCWNGWCPTIPDNNTKKSLIKNSMKTEEKSCDCDDCSQGKACPCGKDLGSHEDMMQSDWNIERDTKGYWAVEYDVEENRQVRKLGPFKSEQQAEQAVKNHTRKGLNTKLAALVGNDSGTQGGYTVPPSNNNKNKLHKHELSQKEEQDMQKGKTRQRRKSKNELNQNEELKDEIVVNKNKEVPTEESSEPPIKFKASANVLGNLYSHAKAENDYVDEQLKEIDHPGVSEALKAYKDSQITPRMESLKSLLQEHHGNGDNPDELMDKCIKGLEKGFETDNSDALNTGEQNKVDRGEVVDEAELDNITKLFDTEEEETEETAEDKLQDSNFSNGDNEEINDKEEILDRYKGHNKSIKNKQKSIDGFQCIKELWKVHGKSVSIEFEPSQSNKFPVKAIIDGRDIGDYTTIKSAKLKVKEMLDENDEEEEEENAEELTDVKKSEVGSEEWAEEEAQEEEHQEEDKPDPKNLSLLKSLKDRLGQLSKLQN